MKRILLSLSVAFGLFFVADSAQAVAPAIHPPASQRLKDFAIVQAGNTWHAFPISVCVAYGSNCEYSDESIRHYISSDMVHWTDLGPALLPRAGNAIDSYAVWAPSIIFANNQWYMFYTGVSRNASNHYVQQIAVATSTNLLDWDRAENNSVLSCGQFSWAYYQPSASNGVGGDCRDPHVQWDEDGDRWLMSFAARREVFGNHPMVIGQAWSTNLTSWNEIGYLATTQHSIAESPHIVQHDNDFFLFWTTNCASGTCLRWASSSSISGPFSAPQNLTGQNWWEYASESITIQGKQFFLTAAVVITIRAVEFGTGPTIVEAPFATSTINASLRVSNQPGAEVRRFLPGVSVLRYRDNGDGIWDPNTDQYIGSVETSTEGQMRNDLLPGKYWYVPEPGAFDPGQALGAISPERYALSVVVDWNSTVTTDWLFRVAGRRWFLGTETLQRDFVAPNSIISTSTSQSFASVNFVHLLAGDETEVKMILSSDAGETWWTVVQGAWVQATGTATDAVSVTALNAELATFPVGAGQFAWRVFTPNEETVLAVDAGVNSGPTSPQLLSPSNGASVMSLTPQFSFVSADQENGLAYIVQTSADPNFLNPLHSSVSLLPSAEWNGLDANRIAPTGQTVGWTPESFLGNGTMYWRVKAIDVHGSGLWSEWSGAMLVAPVALTMSTPTVTYLSLTSARLSWTTVHPTTAYVMYADEEDHEVFVTVPTTSHAIVLENLIPGTNYSFAFYLQDIFTQSVNTVVVSETPTLSTTMNLGQITLGGTSATIAWSTNVASSGVVEYGLTPELGQSVTSSSTDTSHQVELTGLQSGQRYYYRVSGYGTTMYTGTVDSVMTVTPMFEPLDAPLDPAPILRLPRRRS